MHKLWVVENGILLDFSNFRMHYFQLYLSYKNFNFSNFFICFGRMCLLQNNKELLSMVRKSSQKVFEVTPTKHLQPFGRKFSQMTSDFLCVYRAAKSFSALFVEIIAKDDFMNAIFWLGKIHLQICDILYYSRTCLRLILKIWAKP